MNRLSVMPESDSLMSPTRRNRHSNAWSPGFLNQLPGFGILALLLAVACTGGAVAIAAVSNHRGIDSFNVSPPVLLSVISALSNLFLGYAFTQGLIISFWVNALRGCTLPDLHGNWYSGSSFQAALANALRGRNMINSLACILTTLSIVRSPLLQRSLTLVSGIPVITTGNITLGLATYIPDTYGGVSVYTRTKTYEIAYLSSNFTDIMQTYSNDSAMTMDHASCGDSCTATIQGFGFGVNCNSTNITYSFDENGAYQATFFETSADLSTLPDEAALTEWQYPQELILNATFLPAYYEQVTEEVNSSYTSINTTLVQKTCTLAGGVVAYDILLDSGTVSLKSDDWSDDTFLYAVEMLGPDPSGSKSAIGGFQYAASYLFASSATYMFGGAVSSYSLSGSLANQLMAGDVEHYNATWEDPTDYMINQLRNIAFRTALQVGKDNATSNATQTVEYVGQYTETKYVADFGLVAAATVLNVLAIAAVALSYWGWWRLGRKAGLGPLEMAMAFDARLLRDVGGNATASEICEVFRGTKVKYGEAEPEGRGEGVKLMFADEKDVVRGPVSGADY